MCIIEKANKRKGADFMQKRADVNNKISVAAVIREGRNIIKNVDKRVLSAMLCAIMLISTFGFVTKYYTIGYDVYYEDVNIGVTSNKEEAIEAYTDAVTDVRKCRMGELRGDLRFVMTIASVEDMLGSDIYRGIVEAAKGKEDCYSIECDGIAVAHLKTRDEAYEAVNNHIASYNREDAMLYSSYTIAATKEIVTEIVTVEEAERKIAESGLFTVVYKDLYQEEYEIPFNTTIIEDEKVPEGVEMCTQEGVVGKGVRRAVILYENGVQKQDVEPISSLVEAPVDRIIVKGTGKMAGLVENTLPWPSEGRFTSGYGRRWGRNHTGIDIAAKPGTPIYAPAMGTVTFSDTRSGYGNYIMIDHGNGYVTTYAHMTTRYVKEGDVVAEGTLIGTVGSTGRVTGPHLHFEILCNGSYVDPMLYIAG